MDFASLISERTNAMTTPALRQITVEVQKINGINLGQGTCQLPTPPLIIEEAHRAALQGINRYTNPRGLQSLREAIARKLKIYNGLDADPETEVLIASGATGAFESVCSLLLNPGDEVAIFEPTYPYHVQAVEQHSAKINYVPLELQGEVWTFDAEKLRAAITPRTKFLVMNTPGNPTGKVYTRSELESVAAVLDGTDALLVTDEIYEYMVFDGRKHLSPATIPALKDRTITIGGYSKTFSITGWRIGYCIAPTKLAALLTSIMDRVYVCAPAPLQEGVAQGVNSFDSAFYEELKAKYQKKRDRFAAGVREIGLHPMVPEGAYYMLIRFDELMPGISSWDFARRLVEKCGVGAVPSNDFVRDSSSALWVRFCLAVEDLVLEDALNRMGALRPVSV
jgi:aminotransferase